MPKTIAAIPAYNESSRIRPVIQKAKKYVDEVIVVDDHSRDNTLQVAKEAGAIAVRLVTNMGAGFATRTACDIAVERGADFIITLDSDGQHDPAEIPQMIKPLTKGYDVVFGCRPRDQNMPAVKRLGNWGLTIISKLLFGINVNDSQSGFRAFTADAFKRIRWESDRYGMVSEFVSNTAKSKVKWCEVSIKTIYNDKKWGMRKRDALRAVIAMLKWRLFKW